MKILHYHPNAPHPARDNDGVGRAVDAMLLGIAHNQYQNQLYLYNTHPETAIEYMEYACCNKVVTKIDEQNLLKDYDIVVYHGGPDLFIQDKRYIRMLHWCIVGPDTVRDMQAGNNTVVGVSKAALQFNNLNGDYVYSTKYLSVGQKNVIKQGIKNKSDYYIWLGGTDWYNQKGLDVAIRIAKIAKIRLLIFGSGQNQDVIKQIEKQCDDKIKYLGPTLDDNYKYSMLSQARGLLYPSAIPDGCPMTVVESLMCGCPVFAYNHTVFPELVEEGWGHLFDTGNKQSMLRFILHNTKWDYESIMNGAQQKFDYMKLAEQHINIYKKILGVENFLASVL